MRLPVALAVPEGVGQIRTVQLSRQERRNVVIFIFHLWNKTREKEKAASSCPCKNSAAGGREDSWAFCTALSLWGLLGLLLPLHAQPCAVSWDGRPSSP